MLVRAYKGDRSLTGFEAMSIANWLEDNVGREDVAWGRTDTYGWWIASRGHATQFLLVWQCADGDALAASKGLTNH